MGCEVVFFTSNPLSPAVRRISRHLRSRSTASERRPPSDLSTDKDGWIGWIIPQISLFGKGEFYESAWEQTGGVVACNAIWESEQ